MNTCEYILQYDSCKRNPGRDAVLDCIGFTGGPNKVASECMSFIIREKVMPLYPPL